MVIYPVISLVIRLFVTFLSGYLVFIPFLSFWMDINELVLSLSDCFSKYSMEVFSANLFALLDRYRDTSLIYLLTPNPNTTRRYFFVPPKTLLQSCTSMGLFLGLLLGFLAFRKKGFFDIIQAFCRTYVNESNVHFGNCT